MRVDLPYCGFKNCRHCFDGNCTKPSGQEKCDYWYLLHEELPSAEPKTPSNGSITCVKSEKMHDRTTDGLIRRQDVLHELEGCDYELKDWQRWKLKTMVRDIPSAENAQLSGEDATKDATSDLISRKEMLRTYQELCRNISCSECSSYFCDASTGDCLLEKWIHSLPSVGGCKCPCEYREPCDVCHYDGHLWLGCPAERRGDSDV